MPSPSDIPETKEGEQLLRQDDAESGTVGSPRSDRRSLGLAHGVPRAYLIAAFAAALLGGALVAVALGDTERTQSTSARLAQQEALCRGPLCDKIGAFSDSGVGATEFTLYTLWAYAKRKNNTFDCIHSIEKLQHFRLNHTEDWKEKMHQQISGLGFPEDLRQITISDGDGWPLDWTPDQIDSEPTADKFPIMFEDLTRKWASSLWRGEESNQDLLVQVNLHTLDDVVSGVRQFPLMFGAQPASLKPMSKQERVMATDQLVEMYKQANLYDPDDDLVNCTIGWKN